VKPWRGETPGEPRARCSVTAATVVADPYVEQIPEDGMFHRWWYLYAAFVGARFTVATPEWTVLWPRNVNVTRESSFGDKWHLHKGRNALEGEIPRADLA